MKKYCIYCMSEIENDICPCCGRKNENVEVPAHHLLPGALLNDRYYVGLALGEGGFGITYIGRDLNLDMKIAIKEYYPNGYVNRSNTVSASVNDSITEGRKDFFEKGRQRFLSEARTLAKFSGEQGIVDVRDFFEENNTAYIIMEYLEGVDLKTYLKQNGTLSPEETIKVLTPVMQSLRKVHDDGLIHRDISPDNIMIFGDKVKLLDFGAARSVSALANKSLSIMLKPGFAPEEQYRSKGNQGPWTDIYSLCATMYKCITGITPDDATQRMYCDEVKTPSALGITIDTNIENAIMRGMSVHQSNRYQSIDDLFKGLQGIEVNISSSVDEGKTITPLAVQEDYKLTQYGGNSNIDIPAELQKKDGTELKNNNDKKDRKKGKKTKAIIVASVGAVICIVIAVLILSLFGNGNNSDFDPYITGFIVEGSNPVELDFPEQELSADDLYSSINYIEEMFYGDYSIELKDKNDEEIEIYKSSSSYGALKDNDGRLLTNIPYRIEAGPKTLNHKICSIKEHHWMRAYYYTEDGYYKEVIAAYEVKNKSLILKPLKTFDYNEKTNKVEYSFSEQTVKYDFVFSGPIITLSYKEESLSLIAHGFCLSKYADDYSINVSNYSSSNKIDNIDCINFYFSQNNNRFYLVDGDNKTINDCIGHLSMEGLFTFTYSDGHVKNTKYYTHQFIYFYCYKDGIILCDNKNVYMYQKNKKMTEEVDNDESITDEIDTVTEENSTANTTSKYYSSSKPSSSNSTKPSSNSSTNIVTTEMIYSDTTQTSEITEILESSAESNIATTADTILSSENTEALDNYYNNSSEAAGVFSVNNYDENVEDM